MDPYSKLLYFLTIALLVMFTLRHFEYFRDLRRIFLSKKQKTDFDQFFARNFNYYNFLTDSDKKRFIFRVYNLSQKIKIVGRQNFQVTNQVKLVVLAAHVQLTFGLDYYLMPIFKTILIYPGAYRNPITGRMHDGEINPRGLLVLSWEKFTKGYFFPTDKINLGLHELAHALMISIIKTKGRDQSLDYYLNEIIKISNREIQKIRNKETHFFRDYAGENVYEFFAVAVEHFFEAPEGFKLELPALYMYMTKLLKQDPALKKNRL
ncbi:MAG: zinc-dependent peptidase [Bacteroidales bacterium]|nr:zinc-dependent peptidase [Bacteroidales bacterium]